MLIAALETGDVELLGDAMFNDLQAGVVSRHPEVAAAIDGFLEAGPSAPSSAGAVPRSPRSPGIGHAEALAAAVAGSIVVSGPPRYRGHAAGSSADPA